MFALIGAALLFLVVLFLPAIMLGVATAFVVFWLISLIFQLALDYIDINKIKSRFIAGFIGIPIIIIGSFIYFISIITIPPIVGFNVGWLVGAPVYGNLLAKHQLPYKVALKCIAYEECYPSVKKDEETGKDYYYVRIANRLSAIMFIDKVPFLDCQKDKTCKVFDAYDYTINPFSIYFNKNHWQGAKKWYILQKTY